MIDSFTTRPLPDSTARDLTSARRDRSDIASAGRRDALERSDATRQARVRDAQRRDAAERLDGEQDDIAAVRRREEQAARFAALLAARQSPEPEPTPLVPRAAAGIGDTGAEGGDADVSLTDALRETARAAGSAARAGLGQEAREAQRAARAADLADPTATDAGTAPGNGRGHAYAFGHAHAPAHAYGQVRRAIAGESASESAGESESETAAASAGDPPATRRSADDRLAMVRALLGDDVRGGPDARGDRDATTTIDAILAHAGSARGRAIANALRAGGASSSVVRDTEALDPALRERLDRVVARMRDEFGHDVQVVETLRSPERQAALFAQGRSTPGPVVTWTKQSAHLDGRAVDVMIDGGWENTDAFRQLQQIAKEEGLHTLGARDPGHLEWRGDRTLTDATPVTTDATDAAAATTVRGPRIARAAAVAQVAATPAAVAAPAAVASVATPGQQRAAFVSHGAMGDAMRAERSRARGSDDATTVRQAPGHTTTAADARLAAAAANASSNGGTHERAHEDAPRRDGARERSESAIGALHADARAFGAMGAERTGGTVATTPDVAPVVRSDAAQRAETIASLREDGPAGQVSSLTLRTGDGDDASHVRVAMRDGRIEARITTDNRELADHLRLRTAELQDALGRRGIDGDGVRVQATRAGDAETVRLATDRAEAARLTTNAGANAGNQQSGADDPSARDRWQPRSGERDARSPRDDADRRGRRDPQEDRTR